MPGHAIGQRLAAVAARSDGLITSAALGDLGVTKRQIYRWTQSGRLHRLHYGVYAVGHVPQNSRTTYRAALLAAGARSALGYSTALAYRGVVDLREMRGEVHVVAQRGGPRPPAGAKLHRVTNLDEREVEVVNGLRCTSVALSLVHLAAVLEEDALRFACERAEYKRQLDVSRIARIVLDHGRLAGVGKLRNILRDTSFDTALLDSSLERRALRLIAAAGLPAPVVQQPFRLAGHGNVRVDLWYPDARLVVEIDGPHHRLPLQAAKDARRDEAFRAIGITVLRFDDTLAGLVETLGQQLSGCESDLSGH